MKKAAATHSNTARELLSSKRSNVSSQTASASFCRSRAFRVTADKKSSLAACSP